tara:strand:+ start:585 stop:833 length:249 start_codon:yes stop_codon:yes gene_type:complete
MINLNFDYLVEIVSDLSEVDPEVIKNSDLLEEGILDSMFIINLISLLENTYSISIEDSDILPENFNNINSIFKLLKRYANKN